MWGIDQAQNQGHTRTLCSLRGDGPSTKSDVEKYYTREWCINTEYRQNSAFSWVVICASKCISKAFISWIPLHCLHDKSQWRHWCPIGAAWDDCLIVKWSRSSVTPREKIRQKGWTGILANVKQMQEYDHNCSHLSKFTFIPPDLQVMILETSVSTHSSPGHPPLTTLVSFAPLCWHRTLGLPWSDHSRKPDGAEPDNVVDQRFNLSICLNLPITFYRLEIKLFSRMFIFFDGCQVLPTENWEVALDFSERSLNINLMSIRNASWWQRALIHIFVDLRKKIEMAEEGMQCTRWREFLFSVEEQIPET